MKMYIDVWKQVWCLKHAEEGHLVKEEEVKKIFFFCFIWEIYLDFYFGNLTRILKKEV